MSKEQTIRETAYAIWEAEGQPDGQNDAHWQRAEQLVNEQGVEEEAPKKSGAKKAPIIGQDPNLAVGGN